MTTSELFKTAVWKGRDISPPSGLSEYTPGKPRVAQECVPRLLGQEVVAGCRVLASESSEPFCMLAAALCWERLAGMLPKRACSSVGQFSAVT